jgi:hypothetical protein
VEDQLPISKGDQESIWEQADPMDDPITVLMIPNLPMFLHDVLHHVKVVPNVFRRSWTVLRSQSRRRVKEVWEEIWGAATAEMLLGPM